MSVATGTLSNLIKKQSLKDSPVTVGSPIAKSAGGGTGFLSSIYRGVDGSTGKQLIDAGGRGIQVSHLESESYGGIPSVGPLMTAASWRHVPRNVIPNGHMIMKHNQPNIGPFVSTQRLDPPTATLVYNDFDSTISDRQLNVHPDGGRIKSPLPNLENAAQLGQIDLEISRLQQLIDRAHREGVVEDEAGHRWRESDLMEGIETLRSAKKQHQDGFTPSAAIGDGGSGNGQEYRSSNIGGVVDREMQKTQKGFMGMIKKVFDTMESMRQNGLKKSFEIAAVEQLNGSIEVLIDELRDQAGSSGINITEFTDVLEANHTQMHEIMVLAKEDQRLFKEQMEKMLDTFRAGIAIPEVKSDIPVGVSPESKSDSPVELKVDLPTSGAESPVDELYDEKADPTPKVFWTTHTVLKNHIKVLQDEVKIEYDRWGEGPTGSILVGFYNELSTISDRVLDRIPAGERVQGDDGSIRIPTPIVAELNTRFTYIFEEIKRYASSEIPRYSEATRKLAETVITTQLELTETKEELQAVQMKLEQVRNPGPEVVMESPESSPVVGLLPPTIELPLPIAIAPAVVSTPIDIPAVEATPMVEPIPTPIEPTPSPPAMTLDETVKYAEKTFLRLRNRDYEITTGAGKRFIAVGDGDLARKLIMESDFGTRLAKTLMSDFESHWMGPDAKGIELTPFEHGDISFILDALSHASTNRRDLYDSQEISAIAWSIAGDMMPFLEDLAIRAATRGPAIGVRGLQSAFERSQRGDLSTVAQWGELALHTLRDAHQADIASKKDGAYTSDYLQRFSTMVRRLTAETSEVMGEFENDLGHFIAHASDKDARLVRGFNVKPIVTRGNYLNFDTVKSFKEVSGGSVTSGYRKYSGDILEQAKMRIDDISKIGGGPKSTRMAIDEKLNDIMKRVPEQVKFYGDFPDVFLSLSAYVTKECPAANLMDLSMEEASCIMDLSNFILGSYGLGEIATQHALEEVIGKIWLNQKKELIGKFEGDHYMAFRGYLANYVMDYDTSKFHGGPKFFDAIDYTSSAEYGRLLSLKDLFVSGSSLSTWKKQIDNGHPEVRDYIARRLASYDQTDLVEPESNRKRIEYRTKYNSTKQKSRTK